MNFEPTNRHILVNPIEEKKEEKNSLIMLPDDYKKQESPYLACSVLAVASDSKLIDSVHQNDTIIVERRMLEKIEMKGKEIYLVLDNYVMGRFTK
jgi:co-chaperonin GroES (HSP10)|tara:strand:- start:1369 stop:1653 length:285 start_codon:yes stop_codon:yes gene_type:complete